MSPLAVNIVQMNRQRSVAELDHAKPDRRTSTKILVIFFIITHSIRHALSRGKCHLLLYLFRPPAATQSLPRGAPKRRGCICRAFAPLGPCVNHHRY